jgi:hypothetical protein
MRSTFPYNNSLALVLGLLSILLFAIPSQGQTTAFTYQGRLTDGGTAANGNYDLQFALWNSLSGGTQVGSTQSINNAAVSNGVFTVTLDFGANAFPGGSRFLEISTRPSGLGSFTLLTPRQPITSTPYAVRSLNASTADSVAASGVSAGSGNYIQNSNSPQATSNFNISGNGTAGGTLSGTAVNATTQYNLNGSRILSNAGFQNLFAGIGAGESNTGISNSFFGFNAGRSNTSGGSNSFFGLVAGSANTTGDFNSFFGAGAGQRTTTAFDNSFFGARAGFVNTEGQSNSFFGTQAGLANTTGSTNSFFGRLAGGNNTTGQRNSFFGSGAGTGVSSGTGNTFIGEAAGGFVDTSDGNNNTLLGARTFVTTGVSGATAIGANARVDASNSLVLGTAETSVGIGTTAPTAKLSVVATGDGARVLHLGIERAWVFKQLRTGAETALELTGSDPNNNNKHFVINTTGSVGIGTTAPTATLSVNGTANKPGGGSWGSFSDERLKNIKGRFTSGLKAVMQLQPLRYEYKRDNALNLRSEGEHVGFSAQAVQKIIPEAVTATGQGYLLVNNDPILWTMLNAIKEQQAQILNLQKVNTELSARLLKVERASRKKMSARRRR